MISGQCEMPFHFFRLVRVHPVVKPRPLRVTAMQNMIRKFAHVLAATRFGKNFLIWRFGEMTCISAAKQENRKEYPRL